MKQLKRLSLNGKLLLLVFPPILALAIAGGRLVVNEYRQFNEVAGLKELSTLVDDFSEISQLTAAETEAKMWDIIFHPDSAQLVEWKSIFNGAVELTDESTKKLLAEWSLLDKKKYSASTIEQFSTAIEQIDWLADWRAFTLSHDNTPSARIKNDPLYIKVMGEGDADAERGERQQGWTNVRDNSYANLAQPEAEWIDVSKIQLTQTLTLEYVKSLASGDSKAETIAGLDENQYSTFVKGRRDLEEHRNEDLTKYRLPNALRVEALEARPPNTLAVSKNLGSIFDKHLESLLASSKNSLIVSLTATLLAIVACSVIAIFLQREISNAMKRAIATLETGTNGIVNAAKMLTETSQGLSQTASEQAAGAEILSASIHEITSISKLLTKSFARS